MYLEKCKLGALIALASLFVTGCSKRDPAFGQFRTKTVWHGLQRCSTRQEDLPYDWGKFSKKFEVNFKRSAAGWVYVTICESPLGVQTPTAYQIVLYDPQRPMFSLQGEELQKYLDENTAVSVDTTDIGNMSPFVVNAFGIPKEMYQGDRDALMRDLGIRITCSQTCEPAKIHIRLREWHGAKLYFILADPSAHQI